MRLMRAILQDERGATAIEYGLIVSLIVIAMIASVGQLANFTVGMWNDVSTEVEESSRRGATR